uniref:Secreted protein n=1 Tax=Arundo donax TaxID=35708 RepID=A0A0A9GA09_ARUDO
MESSLMLKQALVFLPIISCTTSASSALHQACIYTIIHQDSRIKLTLGCSGFTNATVSPENAIWHSG